MRPVTAHFVNQMNKLSNRFGTTIVQPEFLNRCWTFMHDLPDEAVEECIATNLDESRYAPLPKDFREFARSWRARNKVVEDTYPEPIHCTHCMDGGYVWLDFENEAVWAFCICIIGKSKKSLGRFNLPQIQKENLSFLKIRDFPINEFTPKRIEILEDAIFVNTAFDMWDKWKKELKTSERFWESMRRVP